MKKRTRNIKNIAGAALLALALLGGVLTIASLNADVEKVAATEVAIDMEKSISVLP